MWIQWIPLTIAWNKGENDEISMENLIVFRPFLIIWKFEENGRTLNGILRFQQKYYNIHFVLNYPKVKYFIRVRMFAIFMQKIPI